MTYNFAFVNQTMTAALKKIAKAVPSKKKSVLPITTCVCIEPCNGGVYVHANNLELSMVIKVGAKMNADFHAIALPYKELVDTLKAFKKNERVDVTVDPKTITATFTQGGASATIKGIDGDEFPGCVIPENTIPVAKIENVKLFQSAAMFAVDAAAREDNRPVLTGVLMRSEGKTAVTFAGADGYRLHAVTMEDTPFELDQVLIPAKSLAVVLAQLDPKGLPLTIRRESRGSAYALVFEQELMTAAIMEIEGRFPQYESIIPENSRYAVEIDPAEMLSMCNALEPYARDSANTVRAYDFLTDGGGKGMFMMSARSQEKGDAQVFVECKPDIMPFAGRLLTALSANVFYLQSALAGYVRLLCPKVNMAFKTPVDPFVFRPAEDINGLRDVSATVMPMSVITPRKPTNEVIPQYRPVFLPTELSMYIEKIADALTNDQIDTLNRDIKKAAECIEGESGMTAYGVITPETIADVEALRAEVADIPFKTCPKCSNLIEYCYCDRPEPRTFGEIMIADLKNITELLRVMEERWTSDEIDQAIKDANAWMHAPHDHDLFPHVLSLRSGMWKLFDSRAVREIA